MGTPSAVTGQNLAFEKGSVIFGRRRAYQRKPAAAEFDGICSAHAMVVRAKPKVILVTTQFPGQGISIGTWPELIEQPKSAYLLIT